MSKCRPDCCSGNSSDPGFGIIVLLLIIVVGGGIEILRVIAHAVEHVLPVVVDVLETAAITAGSITAVIVTAWVARRLVRWHQRHRRATALRPVITITPEAPIKAPQVQGPAELSTDTAQIFAEAVASDMDPRFIERIISNAFERRET